MVAKANTVNDDILKKKEKRRACQLHCNDFSLSVCESVRSLENDMKWWGG